MAARHYRATHHRVGNPAATQPPKTPIAVRIVGWSLAGAGAASIIERVTDSRNATMAVSAAIAGLGGIAIAGGKPNLGEAMIITGLATLAFAWLGDPRPNDPEYRARRRDARRIAEIRRRERVGADPADFIRAEQAPALAYRHPR